jgi:hypothetical protein
MSPSQPAPPESPSNANSKLATEIVAALRAADFIGPTEEKAAMMLLTTAPAKAGDWRLLLEKNLAATTIATDHAATHHTA